MKTWPRWAKWGLRFFLAYCVLAVVMAVLFPVGHSGARSNARRASCRANLRQIGLAFQQYIRDYDELYPLVSNRRGQGWADVLAPYTKSRALFQCPEGYKPESERSSDYFYNARVVKLTQARWQLHSQVILTGDGADNGGTDAHLSDLPSTWKSENYSPAKRHLEGANYGFADGSVRWLRPEKIPKLKPTAADKTVYSFAIK